MSTRAHNAMHMQTASAENQANNDCTCYANTSGIVKIALLRTTLSNMAFRI